MNTVIVIPARYGSSRFPGKPLALVAGHSLLSRVWKIAKAVPGVQRVIVATDDQRIEMHARSFGAEVVMTSASCENGTERVFEALKSLNSAADLVINFQGDAVLTPPTLIKSLVASMQSDRSAGMGTLACQVSPELARGSTLVVFDAQQHALYFSRALIPHYRDELATRLYYKHIGIYAYRPDTLKQFVELPPSSLENSEKLEQLRALENGIAIKVALVDSAGRSLASIDTPQDVDRVEEIIAREGELVK